MLVEVCGPMLPLIECDSSLPLLPATTDPFSNLFFFQQNDQVTV